MTDSIQPKPDFSADRRKLLEILLKEEGLAEKSSLDTIPPRPVGEPTQLSYTQQRLWFLDQMEPGNPNYNISLAIRLRGPLEISALEKSINEIVKRHETLRTTFGQFQDRPVQIVSEFQPMDIRVSDLETVPFSAREETIRRLVEAEAIAPFDLEKGPLFRISLLALDDADHILLVTMHHIISDGWSLGVLLKELEALYNAFTSGQASTLTSLPIQYGDFAAWQRDWLQGKVLEKQIDYWRKNLGGSPGVLELPTDHPRPAVQTYHGAQVVLELPAPLRKSLQGLGREQDATLFMTLLAGFNILLGRLAGQEDLNVCAPIAGRNRVETEGLIGFFINSLVLRTILSGNPSFRDLLSQVRETTLGAYENQDIPFEKLVEVLNPERDMSRTPLFQVMFNMLNLNLGDLNLNGLTAELISRAEPEAKFDLTLYAVERSEVIQLNLVYNTDLFSEKRMKEMLSQYQNLLVQIVDQPDRQVYDYSLVTSGSKASLADPRQKLIAEWEGSVHDRFMKNANQVPTAIALNDPCGSWSYGQLNLLSNQLAYYLRRRGIQNQDVVAIYGHRSAALVWAVLGVLKAGGAFVILDPAYPSVRLIETLRQASPHGWLQIQAAGDPPDELKAFLAAQGDLAQLILPGSVQEADSLMLDIPHEDLRITVNPDDLAYLAFTSGSTGKPKGILGTHRPLAHFFEWYCQTFDLRSSDRFSMLSGLSHDPLLRDIFTPLWLGATLRIPEPDTIHSPEQLVSWIYKQEITVAHLTPSLGKLLTQADLRDPGDKKLVNLRYAFFGGDRLLRQLYLKLRQLAPEVIVVSFYGTTETPQGMAYKQITDKPVPNGERSHKSWKEVVPLGKGIDNVQLLILNSAGQQAGIGELGEICIRTPYLTQGYLDDEQLTQERYIQNPFIQDDECRIYKTGDLGRYLPNGEVEFAGRSDSQVNIRGYRIELSEVEGVLSQNSAVQSIAVKIWEDKNGDNRLVAYVVPAANVNPGIEDLRRHISKQLPDYMVPSVFVFLDNLPLTPNGKLDERALPEPSLARPELAGAYISPESPVEKLLAEIWTEVLGVERVGIQDNFFDLGGHSLLSVRLFVRIREVFDVNLPLNSLFRNPTIEYLAELINEQAGLKTWSSLVEMQPYGSHQPFYCVHGLTGDTLWFENLIPYICPDQPLWGLQSQGLDGVQEPLLTIEEMASHYVDEIRRFQPNGPYYLGGYSFGGTIAYEMARQFSLQNQEVGLIAIIDHATPKSDYYHYRLSLNFLINVLRNLPYRAADFLRLRPDQVALRLTRKVRRYGKRLKWLLLPSARRSFQVNAADLIDEAPHLPEHIQKIIEVNFRAVFAYNPQQYSGKITLIRARGGRLLCNHDPKMGWGKFAQGGVDIRIIPGSHLSIFKQPHIRYLAEKIQVCLDEAQSEIKPSNTER